MTEPLPDDHSAAAEAPAGPRARISRRAFLFGGAAALAAGGLGLYAADGFGRLGLPVGRRMPDFVYRTPGVYHAYRLALAQPDLLAGLDCYCGCSQYDPPHANLLDCFVTPAGALDPHGSVCPICVDEATDAGQWRAEGVPLAEMRLRVETRYRGRGEQSGCGSDGDTPGGCKIQQ